MKTGRTSVNIIIKMHLKLVILFFLTITPLLDGHIVGDKAYMSQLKKLCESAYTCVHDAVIVCGKSVHEPRTFLDLCDLYEYSCEFNMVFRHVKEEEGCPNPRNLT